MNTYWLSWYHVVNGHDFDSPRLFYITGSTWQNGPRADIELECICLAVDAPSELEAKAYVHSLYEAPVELAWRFCIEHHHGWTPKGSRFRPIAHLQS